MRTIVTATALVLAVGLATGSAGAQGAPAVATEAKPDKSKKVCRTIVTSGTRFSKRICRSQEDWEKDAEYAGRLLEKGQTYGSRRDGEMNGQGLVQPPR